MLVSRDIAARTNQRLSSLQGPHVPLAGIDQAFASLTGGGSDIKLLAAPT